MMHNLYTMARVAECYSGRGFGGTGRMSFADQIAVDADRAANDVVSPGASEVRMERVRELKAAIETGRYCVSSEDLAERIMASMMGEVRRAVQ